MPQESESVLMLTSKYGCDGTSGFSMYKQKFVDSSTDESIFMISMVPISLFVVNENYKAQSIWENSKSNSTRLCRPLKFEFAKETKEKILLEMNTVRKEVQNLTPSKIELNGKTYFVKHKLHNTMIDGKVCQALTNTSSSNNCVICGAKPTQMNDIEAVAKRKSDISAYQYGLQTLHAWIRLMECVLHISYRLTFQRWACKEEQHKQHLASAKSRIQNQLRNELGILVDLIKQGSGNTNDGNTARTFSENYEKVSKITNFDQDLLKRFYVILQLIASEREIDIPKFKEYMYNTAVRYVILYSWYYMPASLHKILLHGADIIDSFDIPIGKLSEEAQEARNKDFKMYRTSHSRKFSRIDTNEDILHSLLFTSDPYITSLRQVVRKVHKPFHPEAEEMLKDRTNVLH